MPTRALWIAAAAAIPLLTACGDNVRKDPFAEIATVRPAPAKELTAVMALSKNTIEAMPYMNRYRGVGAASAGEGLFSKLAEALRGNFKTVVKVDSIEQTKSADADVVVILDVYTKANVGLGAISSAEISAIVLARDGSQIDVVKAEHSVTGWKYTGAGAMAALAEGAAAKFDEALRSSSKLAEFARARVPGSAAPARPAAASEKPSLQPAFADADRLDDYAVVIGIEDYADLPAATYAERDARAAKTFIRAMGVPERNIMLLTGSRATKNGLEKTLEGWLPNNVSEKSRVFIYYSGHGAPDTKTGDAYLVPLDGDPQYLAQTGYPLKRLYSKLGELKAKSVLVALDSCFSGAGGRSVLAKGTRPLVGKVDMAVEAQGKISVISASAGDQISGTNEDAGYGLFTYNLLQGLNGGAKDSRGKVTLESLYGYLKPRVQDDARRGNREQTPQLRSGGADFVLRVSAN